MPVIYRNSASEITLAQAISLYQQSIAVIITDGRDVTFESERG